LYFARFLFDFPYRCRRRDWSNTAMWHFPRGLSHRQTLLLARVHFLQNLESNFARTKEQIMGQGVGKILGMLGVLQIG
jgi:hypothetical protein